MDILPCIVCGSTKFISRRAEDNECAECGYNEGEYIPDKYFGEVLLHVNYALHKVKVEQGNGTYKLYDTVREARKNI